MKRTRGTTLQSAPTCSSRNDDGTGIDNNVRSELVEANRRGGFDDSSVAAEALGLVCGSGFARVENLSLVCLLYCSAVREGLSWRLVIQEETPARLISLLHSNGLAAREDRGSRIPLPLTIVHIRYNLKRLLKDITWPIRLRRLSFGEFNDSLEAVRWPPRLELIWLGQRFNQPIADVDWPASLKQLRFGHDFDHDVQRVRWPAGLEQLVFGHNFNQPVVDMKEWPPSLRLLSFGHAFNQAVRGVDLPPRLEFLEFGHEFNQDIAGMPFPPTLQHIRFFHKFNQHLGSVCWPQSLRHVWLCGNFSQPVRDVQWPPALKVLALPHTFKGHGEGHDEAKVTLPLGCRLQLVGCV